MRPPTSRPTLVREQFAHYQAKLPDGLSTEDYFLINMEVGEIVWAKPDALFHDEERWLWLYGEHSFIDEMDKEHTMKIYRDADGFHVDASKCSKETLWPKWDGLVITRIPVVTFTIGEEE